MDVYDESMWVSIRWLGSLTHWHGSDRKKTTLFVHEGQNFSLFLRTRFRFLFINKKNRMKLCHFFWKLWNFLLSRKSRSIVPANQKSPFERNVKVSYEMAFPVQCDAASSFISQKKSSLLLRKLKINVEHIARRIKSSKYAVTGEKLIRFHVCSKSMQTHRVHFSINRTSRVVQLQTWCNYKNIFSGPHRSTFEL